MAGMTNKVLLDSGELQLLETPSLIQAVSKNSFQTIQLVQLVDSIDPSFFHAIETSSSIKTLIVSCRRPYSMEIIPILLNNPHLEKLIFRTKVFTDRDLILVSKALGKSRVSHLEIICPVTATKRGSVFGDVGAQALAAAMRNRGIVSEGDHASAFVPLQVVDISRAPHGISWREARSLLHLTQVEGLSLGKIQFFSNSDNAIPDTTINHSLRRLQIECNPSKGWMMLGSCLGDAIRFPSLTHLDFGTTFPREATDEVVSAIKRMLNGNEHIVSLQHAETMMLMNPIIEAGLACNRATRYSATCSTEEKVDILMQEDLLESTEFTMEEG